MGTQIQEWTVLSMLEWATGYFEKKGIPDPRLSIEWLLAKVLGVKRLDLYLKFDRPISSKELEELRPLIKRRAEHEPLQYILGFAEFMNVRIRVSPDVLIPRIETEQMVEIILDNHPRDRAHSVLDIGTGSGCIPIALKKERPDWSVTGMDISEKALELARQNAKRNNAPVDFFEGDILQWQELKSPAKYSMIVSNPPYVFPEEKETLERQVTEYEPYLALFCSDVETMYRSVIDFSFANLTKEGKLYLEVHELHSQTVLDLFDSRVWKTDLKKDYGNKPRFVIAEKSS